MYESITVADVEKSIIPERYPMSEWSIFMCRYFITNYNNTKLKLLEQGFPRFSQNDPKDNFEVSGVTPGQYTFFHETLELFSLVF